MEPRETGATDCASLWRERLRPGYEQLITSNRQLGSPDDMQLEVVDRSTEEAVQRLCKAGLLQMRIRATRHLHPENGVACTPLSDEERSRIASWRDSFKRKLKMARILAAEDLLDEARDALRDAILSAGRIIAGEARLPEPEKLEEVLFSPLAARWGDNQPLVREFLANPAIDPGPLLRALQSL